jgi:hypothetical protein
MPTAAEPSATDLLPPVLIHPGFHKTGTTFLQEDVFTDLGLFRVLWSHGEIDRFVVKPHDLDFDASTSRDDLDVRRRKASQGVLDVVSSEILCGQPFTGSRDSVTQARRLKAIFDNAKVVFTVRKQPAIIRATYLQYLVMGGSLSPAQFFDRQAPYGYFSFDERVFEFDRLVDTYSGLFGFDNVLVLTQEFLQRDLDGFVSSLRRFCGVGSADEAVRLGDRGRTAVSPPASGIPLIRFANRWRPSAVNANTPPRLGGLGDLLFRAAYRQKWLFRDQGRRLDQAIAERFSGRFADSNARLQRFTPCDLRAQGYEMPPQAVAPPRSIPSGPLTNRATDNTVRA